MTAYRYVIVLLLWIRIELRVLDPKGTMACKKEKKSYRSCMLVSLEDSDPSPFVKAAFKKFSSTANYFKVFDPRPVASKHALDKR
jgi:hypothetical protein